ncbi:Phytanoyl-CoA dioxygenase (PhyH) [Dyella sp. OK004]|uniref:phytanoyl-CoA dioxygenase family protein n=1 Tax=Dyella sp. OK004 TaxID=1855292 RepID=UPI0008E6C2F9|nr:phytanoyl-CoA dioxygenase family protein [Dyella sp. OK004]SFS07033.1 Phytanoyl-CoA dioxygenase (PhyH) [Dyella sp. OK004]
MLAKTELEQFRTQGYVIRQVLDAGDIARYVDAVETARRERGEHGKMMNLQFLQPGKDVRAVQDIICQPAIRDMAADLLGDGIIIDGASLFYADAGVDYRQGWHRDLMQVPDEQIDPHWFSADYHYNYVQANISLTLDPCLWIVPGSHRRPLNEAEQHIFGNDLRIAPVDAQPELDEGRQLLLQPGQAVFYNNYAVHRGYAGVLAERRITIHLGFHSSQYEPTCHFGVLDHREYTPEYLGGLAPDVRAALEAHIAERERHPQVDQYHAWHQQFISKEFVIK